MAITLREHRRIRRYSMRTAQGALYYSTGLSPRERELAQRRLSQIGKELTSHVRETSARRIALPSQQDLHQAQVHHFGSQGNKPIQ